MSIGVYIPLFRISQETKSLWYDEKKKLLKAYNRFIKSATILRRNEGPDFFDSENYKILTTISMQIPQNDMDGDFELMDLEENDDDEEHSDTFSDTNPFVTPKAKMGRPSKKGKISPDTLDRRLQPVLATLAKICEDSKIEMFELLGILGRKFYLKGGPDYNFEQGQIFDQVSKGIDPSPKEIPIDLALYTMTSLEIGDKKYHHLSKTLSNYVKFPSKNRVRQRKHEICPEYENSFNQGLYIIT